MRSVIEMRIATALARLAPGTSASRIRRPHFIVSSGRAGTTMLNALFDRHPEVANYPSEANRLWHPQLYPWATSTIEAPPYWLDPAAFTRISLARRTPADDRRVLATFGAFQALRRAPILLVKTVMVTFMLDRVLELFPEARFIHLYRDGRAVAASWVTKDRHKLDSPRARREGLAFSDPELLERYVAYWQATVLEVAQADRRFSLSERGRLHELSYEALCADPRRRLEELAAFMGISAAPFLAQDLDAIRNTNAKSQSSLDAATVARLTSIAGTALRVKGYGTEIE